MLNFNLGGNFHDEASFQIQSWSCRRCLAGWVVALTLSKWPLLLSGKLTGNSSSFFLPKDVCRYLGANKKRKFENDEMVIIRLTPEIAENALENRPKSCQYTLCMSIFRRYLWSCVSDFWCTKCKQFLFKKSLDKIELFCQYTLCPYFGVKMVQSYFWCKLWYKVIFGAQNAINFCLRNHWIKLKSLAKNVSIIMVNSFNSYNSFWKNRQKM
jgi:hypothetical protein